ncbi:MAG: pilus assembly protein [Elusimicrobiota bacterium]|nr:pilus assembly protein [Elusimicrobiota bacterium]
MNVFFRLPRGKKGQATTEVVLLFPIFFILTLFIVKIYGLLVLVQKAEIASFYAARRWQLESHRALQYSQGWDKNFLQKDIAQRVEEYIGFRNASQRKFLALRRVNLDIERTNVWNVVKLTINTYPPRIPFICKYDKRIVCKYPYGMACMRGYNFLCESGGTIEVTKNVINRDRPVGFILPNSAMKGL